MINQGRETRDWASPHCQKGRGKKKGGGGDSRGDKSRKSRKERNCVWRGMGRGSEEGKDGIWKGEGGGEQ